MGSPLPPAEDLVSEVFIGAWRQAGGFKSKSQVSTWLLAIARNKALSARSRHRDEQLDDDIASSITDPADDADAMMDRRDRSAVIRKCLSHLSKQYREAIDLVYYHEKSVEDVAQIIHMPAATVKTPACFTHVNAWGRCSRPAAACIDSVCQTEVGRQAARRIPG
jgi:RNA polymerase sigma-70 factor (ECF subfamily)